MNFFNNLKIGKRLGTDFSAIIALATVVVVVVVIGITLLADITESVTL